MTMNHHIYPKASLSTNTWSGGTTTELFIYPPESSYPNRDFFLRISTATIEIAESNFTALPGLHRQLMVLNGALNLDFGIHGQAALQPFQIAAFEGDWPTSSKGFATDFNVMTKGDYTANIQAYTLKEGEELTIQEEHPYFYYCFQGEVSITQTGEYFSLYKGDAAIIEAVSASTHLKAATASILIAVVIHGKMSF